METRIADIDSIRLTASVAGDPKQPALLLLHGWPHSRQLFAGTLAAFARDFHTIAFDLPGIGDSHGMPKRAEKTVLADILLRGAEALNAKSIVIAGLDVGGMIAYSAARDHGPRIAGAVVMNTVIPGVPPWKEVIANPDIWHFAFHAVPRLPEILVGGRERVYFDWFIDFLAGNRDAITEETRSAFAEAYQQPEALKAGFDWYRAFKADAEHNSRRVAIETPMLYIRGDADHRPIAPYLSGLEEIGVQRLRGEIIDGSGEFLPLEAPEAFIEVIGDFATSLQQDRTGR